MAITNKAKKAQLKKFLAALRKNGYNQARGILFEVDVDNNNEIWACAAGQAVLNLGVVTEKEVINEARKKFDQRVSGRYAAHNAHNKGVEFIEDEFEYLTDKDKDWQSLYARIYNRNDGFDMTCEQIADDLERHYKDMGFL